MHEERLVDLQLVDIVMGLFHDTCIVVMGCVAPDVVSRGRNQRIAVEVVEVIEHYWIQSAPCSAHWQSNQLVELSGR